MRPLLNKYINPFFLIPFVLWLLIGGFLLLQFDSQILFAWINGHHNEWLDVYFSVANKFGEGWLIVIIAFLFFLSKPLRNKWFFITMTLCAILPALLTQFIKYNVVAPRPMNKFDSAEWIHFLPSWDLLHNNSFPSGHSTGAFSLFFCLAAFMPRGYKIWGLLFFLCAISAAYARVYLTAHFFLDVYMGSIIGSVFSLCIIFVVGGLREKQNRMANPPNSI